MKSERFFESLMESVDGEGNENWKRDLIVAISLVGTAILGIILTLSIV